MAAAASGALVAYSSSDGAPTEAIFMGGIAFNRHEKDVFDAISNLKAPRMVRLIRVGEERRSIGFAWICFKSKADAQAFVDSIPDGEPLKSMIAWSRRTDPAQPPADILVPVISDAGTPADLVTIFEIGAQVASAMILPDNGQGARFAVVSLRDPADLAACVSVVNDLDETLGTTAVQWSTAAEEYPAAVAPKGEKKPEKVDKDKGEKKPEKVDKDKGEKKPEKVDKDKGEKKPEKVDKDKGEKKPEKVDKDKGEKKPEKVVKDKGEKKPEKVDKDDGKKPADKKIVANFVAGESKDSDAEDEGDRMNGGAGAGDDGAPPRVENKILRAALLREASVKQAARGILRVFHDVASADFSTKEAGLDTGSGPTGELYDTLFDICQQLGLHGRDREDIFVFHDPRRETSPGTLALPASRLDRLVRLGCYMCDQGTKEGREEFAIASSIMRTVEDVSVYKMPVRTVVVISSQGNAMAAVQHLLRVTPTINVVFVCDKGAEIVFPSPTLAPNLTILHWDVLKGQLRWAHASRAATPVKPKPGPKPDDVKPPVPKPDDVKPAPKPEDTKPPGPTPGPRPGPIYRPHVNPRISPHPRVPRVDPPVNPRDEPKRDASPLPRPVVPELAASPVPAPAPAPEEGPAGGARLAREPADPVPTVVEPVEVVPAPPQPAEDVLAVPDVVVAAPVADANQAAVAPADGEGGPAPAPPAASIVSARFGSDFVDPPAWTDALPALQAAVARNATRLPVTVDVIGSDPAVGTYKVLRMFYSDGRVVEVNEYAEVTAEQLKDVAAPPAAE